MSNKILDEILANTYTQSQAVKRLHTLKDLVVVKLFHTQAKENLKSVTLPLPAHDQQTSWITSLDPKIYEYFDRKNVYNLFTELEEAINKITPLTIYLPFEIPEETVASIGQSLRKTYGKNFLMDIKIDPSLIAGSALVWKGVYKEYSIKQRVEENKAQILKMMKESVVNSKITSTKSQIPNNI